MGRVVAPPRSFYIGKRTVFPARVVVMVPAPMLPGTTAFFSGPNSAPGTSISDSLPGLLPTPSSVLRMAAGTTTSHRRDRSCGPGTPMPRFQRGRAVPTVVPSLPPSTKRERRTCGSRSRLPVPGRNPSWGCGRGILSFYFRCSRVGCACPSFPAPSWRTFPIWEAGRQVERFAFHGCARRVTLSDDGADASSGFRYAFNRTRSRCRPGEVTVSC